MASGYLPAPLDAAVANIDLKNIQLKQSADIDSLRDGGVFFVFSGTHLPANSNGLVIVFEMVRSGTTYLKQIFIGVATTNPGVIWMRSTNGKNAAWQSWFSITGTAVS